MRDAGGALAAGRFVRILPRRDVAGPTTTDAEGVVVVEGVPPVDHVVALATSGRLSARATAAAADLRDGDARVTLHEPGGATVLVQVVDADQRPLPFATVRLGGQNGWVFFDVDERGEQRVDSFTDRDGRRTSRRVEPGDLEILASYGSREGSVKERVPDRSTRSVRIAVR